MAILPSPQQVPAIPYCHLMLILVSLLVQRQTPLLHSLSQAALAITVHLLSIKPIPVISLQHQHPEQLNSLSRIPALSNLPADRADFQRLIKLLDQPKPSPCRMKQASSVLKDQPIVDLHLAPTTGNQSMPEQSLHTTILLMSCLA